MTEEKKKSHHKQEKLEPLNPIAIENKGTMTESDFKELKSVFSGANNDKLEVVDNSGSLDTLFSGALNQLYDDDEISMKTDYEDDDAIFAASKATFISRTCNIPLIGKFIETFEKKRVSKGRKGRSEIILTLQRRSEEELAINRQQSQMPLR